MTDDISMHLNRLADLRTQGIITEEEFEAQKTAILHGHLPEAQTKAVPNTAARSFVERMAAKYKRDFAWRPGSPNPRGSAPQSRREDMERLGVQLSASRLGKDEYGAVITDIPSDWLKDGKLTMRVMPPPFDAEGIRASLVFFDRFDLPTQRLVGYEGTTSTTLNALGLLQRSEVGYAGNPADCLNRLAFDAYVALDGREPGRWSISRSSQPGVPLDELSPRHGFAMSVENALPIFSRDVPLEDVLEFKQKRMSELLSLRQYLSELILEVTRNGSNDFEQSVAFGRFDKALADHMKVMNESNASKVMVSFKKSISWEALSGLGVSALGHTNLALGALGVAATISVKTIAGLRYNKSLSPFEFLTTVNRELY